MSEGHGDNMTVDTMDHMCKGGRILADGSS